MMSKLRLLFALSLTGLITIAASAGWTSNATDDVVPLLQNTASATRSADWATLVDKRVNLYAMQPGVYRSALPDGESQPLLDQLDVKTVINFYQRSDSAWLDDPDVRQIHLPFHVDRVTDTDVIAALRSIRESEALGPVLFHCKHGQHRTGLIAAMYRMVYQGWSKDEALAELHGAGFGGVERLGDAEKYVRQVDIAKIKTALESGACSTSPWALCALKARVATIFNQ